MYRFLALGAMLAFLVAPAVARSADAPAKSDRPTIMVRLQSIDQLLDNGEYLAGLVGYEEQAKQFLGFVRTMVGPKGLEGVDVKNPFVLYANLAPEIANSEAVVMVPIADRDAFLGLLKTRLNLTVDEDKDGLFSTAVPGTTETVHFRFANGYVYASYKNKELVAFKRLPRPADVVGKGDSVLSLSFRVDRLPEEMKKFALGAIENKLAEAKEQPIPNETEKIKALKNQAIDSISAGLKSFLAEGEELTLKIDIDSKKDELALEFDMTAKKGSDLARDIAGLKLKRSLAHGSLSARNTALVVAGNASLPASVKKVLGPAVDDLIKMGLDMVPDPNARDIIEPLAKAAMPTLKAGDIDIGVALFGPSAEGQYTGLTVGKITGGKDLETAIKDAVKKLPDEFRSLVDIDADSAGTTKLHAVRVKDKLDDKMKKAFGESDVWLAFRDDLALAAIGPKAKETLKEALNASPTSGSLFKFELSAGRLVPLFELQNEKAAQRASKEVFGKDPTGDTFALTFDGGDSLRLRAALKGKVVRFIALMEKAKKDN